MKSTSVIVAECRSNVIPTRKELRFALLAMAEAETILSTALYLNNKDCTALKLYKKAVNMPPDEYLGGFKHPDSGDYKYVQKLNSREFELHKLRGKKYVRTAIT